MFENTRVTLIHGTRTRHNAACTFLSSRCPIFRYEPDAIVTWTLAVPCTHTAWASRLPTRPTRNCNAFPLGQKRRAGRTRLRYDAYVWRRIRYRESTIFERHERVSTHRLLARRRPGRTCYHVRRRTRVILNQNRVIWPISFWSIRKRIILSSRRPYVHTCTPNRNVILCIDVTNI